MVSKNQEWSAFQAIRDRSVGGFIGVFFLDRFAETLWLISLGWVLARTTSGGVAGIVLALVYLVSALLIPFGGLVIHRRGARSIATTTFVVRILLMITWTGVLLRGHVGVAAVVAIALGMAVIDGLHIPAMDTCLLELAPQDAQGAGATLERLVQRVAQVVGGLAGGWALSRGTWPSGIAIAVVLAVGLLVLLKKVGRQGNDSMANSEGNKENKNILSGARVVFADRVLRRTLPVHSVFNFMTGGVALVLLPRKVISHHWGGFGYGMIFGAWGLGLFVGTVLIALAPQGHPRRVLGAIAGVGLAGVATVVVGLSTSFAATAGATLVLGVVCGPVGPLLLGVTRVRVHGDDSFSLAAATNSFALDGLEPVGYVVAGLAIGALGVDLGLVAVGIGLIALSGWAVSAAAVWYVAAPAGRTAP